MLCSSTWGKCSRSYVRMLAPSAGSCWFEEHSIVTALLHLFSAPHSTVQMTAILAAMADHSIPIHEARAISSLTEYIYIRARKDELWVLVINRKWLTGMSYVS